MAKGLNVVGLMNVQFAIQQEATARRVVYVLEVNPRASRTVPFVSKATGLQLAKIAARCMVGQSLDSRASRRKWCRRTTASRKPCSRSSSSRAWTPSSARDEVHRRSHGRGQDLRRSLREVQLGAGVKLPKSGKVFLSVKNSDKPRAVKWRATWSPGLHLVATKGTAAAIALPASPCAVNKVVEGRPHIVDMIKNNEIALVINTVEEKRNAIADSARSVPRRWPPA
jgi:carbamoyl-phosphate synthase large subunit